MPSIDVKVNAHCDIDDWHYAVGVPEYRIDELARVAGTTVRNVRAYQDRGLLPPPRRAGRVGLYDDGHLTRLRLIADLLKRGYSLANIGELVGAWESGQYLRDLLGLGEAVAAPWTDETPVRMTAEQLLELFPAADIDDGVERAVSLGLLEPDDDGFLVRSPRQLRAALDLVKAGLPLSAVLQLGEVLRFHVDKVAEAFVDAVTTHVFDPIGTDLPPDAVPRLADVIRRLRPLAQMTVDAQLARAMEHHANSQLGDRMAALLDHLSSGSAAGEAS